MRSPQIHTLFPYTTLFRSGAKIRAASSACGGSSSEPPAHTAPSWRAKRCVSTSPANLAPCRSEEHTSELQSRENLVCRLLLEKKKKRRKDILLRQKII